MGYFSSYLIIWFHYMIHTFKLGYNKCHVFRKKIINTNSTTENQIL